MYQDEIFASTGDDVFMACMVEGNPIIQAYWKDVHGRKVATNWQFEVITTRFFIQSLLNALNATY